MNPEDEPARGHEFYNPLNLERSVIILQTELTGLTRNHAWARDRVLETVKEQAAIIESYKAELHSLKDKLDTIQQENKALQIANDMLTQPSRKRKLITKTEKK